MSAEAYLPAGKQSLVALRDAAKRREGCGLYERATQTVFGEGRVLRDPEGNEFCIIRPRRER